MKLSKTEKTFKRKIPNMFKKMVRCEDCGQKTVHPSEAAVAIALGEMVLCQACINRFAMEFSGFGQ